MSVQSIEAIQPLAQQVMAHAGPSSAAPGFADRVSQELGNLNAQLIGAEQGLQKLASGSAENLHQVMLALEQARLAMQVVSQVRTRVLEAYQDVMRMQV